LSLVELSYIWLPIVPRRKLFIEIGAIPSGVPFLNERSSEVVKQVFGRYYRENAALIQAPRRLELREYGYFIFGQKVMIRHLSFQSLDELRAEIIRTIPLHVYRSAAYYRYPKAPMEEKEWLGADLTFDIDADHLGLSCIYDHTYGICLRCGLVGRGDGGCGRCGSQVATVEWVCENCLGAAKTELLKLIDILLDDFGVSENEIEVGFSGNRGYHVSVFSEGIIEMDQLARREIVGYLTASGFEPALHGIPAPRRRGRSVHAEEYLDPRLDAKGWRGRVTRQIYSLLLKDRGSIEESTLAKGLRAELERAAEAWLEEPRWDAASPRLWESLAREAIKEEAVKIDPVVTTDLHRLIRMSGTLNGKTGLLAMRIDPQRVEEFDPMTEAAVLGDSRTLRVRILFSPRFSMGGEEFDEISEPTEREMPLHAAVYLLCRGLAAAV